MANTNNNKDSGYVDNWQAGKTVTECNLHMLTTEDCSDVIFRVGSEKQVVRAHRYVLVSRSCVFHAMFCGPLAEKGEIIIPEIEPHIFKQFLRYLYTDTVDVTAENIAGLMYTSRKYAVDGLFVNCSSYLENHLSEENVCQILEQCHGYGELDLEGKALKILTEAGVRVVRSPEFLDLCEMCLQKFLKSEQLNLTEENVFEAVLLWAERKCSKQHIKSEPETVRNYLGEMIFDIRFAAFFQEYLVNVVGPSGILRNDERIRIMDRNVNPNMDITPFKSSPRRKDQGTTKKANFKVTRYCSLQAGWNVGQPEAVSLSVNKNIHLVGCQLYGPAYLKESTYTLNILLYDGQDQMLAEPVYRGYKTLRGGGELNDVVFPVPLPLSAGCTYTICVVMTGEETDYGKDGHKSMEANGVKFTFSNSSKSSKGLTTAKKGQIPGLIWR